MEFIMRPLNRQTYKRSDKLADDSHAFDGCYMPIIYVNERKKYFCQYALIDMSPTLKPTAAADCIGQNVECWWGCKTAIHQIVMQSDRHLECGTRQWFGTIKDPILHEIFERVLFDMTMSRKSKNLQMRDVATGG